MKTCFSQDDTVEILSPEFPLLLGMALGYCSVRPTSVCCKGTDQWKDFDLARCTAPTRGHRSASAAADCPACSSRYSGYRSNAYSPSFYSSSGSSGASSGNNGGDGSRSSSSSRPRWSRAGSSVSYTSTQVQSLTPIRETVEARAAAQPDLRDVFLCHAWDDRQGPAKELHELLVAAGVKVWFSEKDLGLGVPMMQRY